MCKCLGGHSGYAGDKDSKTDFCPKDDEGRKWPKYR